MIKATGRYFCDFLQSVDNIHLQMRYTYRKMKSPSMQITDIDNNGAILIYRSNRSGFSKYLMGTVFCIVKIWFWFLCFFISFFTKLFFKGQLLEIAKEIYNLDVKIRVVDSINDSIGGTVGPIELSSKTGLKSVVVKFRLDFDNLEYVMKNCKNYFVPKILKLFFFLSFFCTHAWLWLNTIYQQNNCEFLIILNT